jgi:hypothetical protein
MNHKINEFLKQDIALLPQAMNNTNGTGRYFSMAEYTKALFLLSVGAMAASKTATLQVYQATAAAGTGAKVLTAGVAEITANSLVTKATAALSTVLNADTITINGLVFTAHTNTTTKASRQFSIGSTDDADGTELAACINDATYGVPNVTATNSSGTLTLISTDGEVGITLSQSSTTFTFATVEAQAFVEINASDLDLANGFGWIAANVATTANSVVSAVLLRTGGRFRPISAVGASYG